MDSSFPFDTVFPLDILILTGNSRSDLAEHGVCHCHVLSFLSVVWCWFVSVVCSPLLSSAQVEMSAALATSAQCTTTHNTYNQNKAHPYRQ